MKKITLFFAALFVALSSFAANPTFTGKLYLTPHSGWKADNARFAAYFFTEGETKQEVWVNMTQIETSGVYEVTVPEGSWENVIFCRMNPGAETNGWGSEFWGGQTQNLTPAEGMDHFVVNSANDAWNKPAGEWKKYDPAAKPEPEPQPVETKVYLLGINGWDAIPENEMALVDGAYAKTLTLAAGTYSFKVRVGDNGWNGGEKIDAAASTPGYVIQNGGNIGFTIAAETEITISFKDDKITLKAKGIDKFGAETISSYTVVGDFPCFGGNWVVDAAANDLVKGEGEVWTKNYTEVTLTAQEYQYKVAVNHAWNTCYPADGNIVVKLTEGEGVYDITFTFDASSNTPNCTLTKKSTAPTAVENVNVFNVFVENRTIVAQDDFEIFSITGQNVTNENGRLSNGIYLVRSSNKTAKVIVR